MKANSKNKKRWAFFTYAHNYGDCSRAIEIGKAMQAEGHEVKFFIHGGMFVKDIQIAKLDVEILQPEISLSQHEMLMAMDQHRVPLNTPLPFTEQQLIDMVDANLKALEEFKPDGVFCGLDVSALLAVKYSGLPMITFIPTALTASFFKAGLASFPNALETNPVIRYCLPTTLKNYLVNRIMLGKSAKKSARTYNIVRKRYGLDPVYNYPELVKGDLTLLPDLPELSGLPSSQLSKDCIYTGPVFANLDLPIPPEVKEVFSQDGINVFIAMGSSGAPELLKRVVNTVTSDERYNVVCATTSIIDPAALGPQTRRFYATRFLPAAPVNEMADIAIIHGGQGTVQNAVYSATPVVGFGMQWEQQANLDGLALAGCAIRIPIHSARPKTIKKALEKISEEPYRTNALKLSQYVKSFDGVKETVLKMNEFIKLEQTAQRLDGLSPRIIRRQQ